jgi:hypothetical protein
MKILVKALINLLQHRVQLPSKRKVWTTLNAPFTVLMFTLLIGYFFAPTLIATYQLKSQEQRKIVDEKYQFSSELINLSWKRWFFAKNYFDNWQYEPDFYERKETLWNSYYDTVKDWNIRLVSNFFIIERYFGRGTRESFENSIAPKFTTFHSELLKIRRGEEPDIEIVDVLIQNIRHELYLQAEKIHDSKVINGHSMENSKTN